MKKSKQSGEHYFEKHPRLFLFLFGVLVTLVVVGPFFLQKGIYNHDDFPFHKLRLESYYEAVRNGQFFPKVFPNMANQYGYAADLFYPSILLLPYVFFRILGIPFIQSYLLYQCVITAATFFVSYFCAKKITAKTKESLLFATIYTTAIYRVLDQFLRGALGETLSFIFLPLIALGLYQLFVRKNNEWYWLTIGMSLLICSHFITAYFVFWLLLILFIYLIAAKKMSNKSFSNLVIATISAILLSLWILIPIFQQTRAIKFNFAKEPSLWGIGLNYSLSDLFLNSLGTKATNWNDLKVNIGIFLLIIFLWALISWRKNSNLTKKLTVISGAFLLLATNFFPWSYLSKSMFAFIQFPWRLLAFASLALATLAVVLLREHIQLNLKNSCVIICALFFLTISFSGNMFYSFKEKNVDLVTNENYQTFQINAIGGGAEYLPAGTNYQAIQQDQTREPIFSTNTNISNYQNVDGEISFQMENAEDTTVTFPKFFYVGYEVLVDDKAVKITPRNGLVAAEIPAGSHNVSLKYVGTSTQFISLIISSISFVALLGWIGFEKFHKKKPQRIS